MAWKLGKNHARQVIDGGNSTVSNLSICVFTVLRFEVATCHYARCMMLMLESSMSDSTRRFVLGLAVASLG